MTPLTSQIESYLESLAARPASPRTIHTYRSELAHLERFAIANGCTSAEELTEDLVRKCSVALLRQGQAAVARADFEPTRSKGNEGAARTMVIAARGFSRYLRKRGLKVADLCGVEAPRQPERLQPRVRAHDFARLEAALDRRAAFSRYPRFQLARDHALNQFLMETGLRALEVSRMDVDDLDLETGEVQIREGKGRKPRLLGIWDPQAEDGGETIRRLRIYIALRAKRKGANRQRALWLGTRGGRMSPESLRTALYRLCEEAELGENKPPHAYRRGWFTAAYNDNPRDLPVLSARMGWSDRSQHMVAVYTRGALMEIAAAPRPLVTRTCFVREARAQ